MDGQAREGWRVGRRDNQCGRGLLGAPQQREGGSAATTLTYKESLAWLYRLQRFGIKLGLENIRRLIQELDAAPRGSHVIHVAGTNGKGSVCAMVDSICRAGKFRTGLFISPHLVTFRERVRVNGEMISESDVASGLTTIKELVTNWEPHPTFFEITTALALKYFANEKTDVVVLETGLGGRLDATNAVDSTVSVITPIALDHEKWLGDSIEKIASEKAGIIKPKTPVICAPQPEDAEKVIRRRAAECEAPLEIVNQMYADSPIALRGEYQKLNAAMAIAAVRAAKINVADTAIARGLAQIEWPARFQCWDKRTVIDGAHNPAAAKLLAQSWREIFANKRATVILAVLSDKDLRGICDALAPIAQSFLLPKIRTERATNPDDLAQICASVCTAGVSSGNRSGCPTISVVANFEQALAKAREKATPILITGSLHFAGEALAHLQGEPAAFEECGQ